MRVSLLPLTLLVAFGAPPPEACLAVPPTAVRPSTIGLKEAPIAALVQAAKEADTDGFAILKDGKLIAAFGERKPYLIYSVTKAVTGMAAGRLFTDGKWTNLDAPLGELLPQFTGDPKGATTMRQLMSHTSGIRDARDANGRVLGEWNGAPDWVAAALRQPMESAPGSVYRYNNLGPTLIAAAVERASGERLDRYLRRTVFDPICLQGKTSWITDAAGHAAGYTGLSISAFDLAKLGQLILNRGRWHSSQILSEDWVKQSALASSQAVNPRVGLLWFLTWNDKFPLPLVVSHSGDGGQNLMIFPNHGIVVARLRRSGIAKGKEGMDDLADLVINALVNQQAQP